MEKSLKEKDAALRHAKKLFKSIDCLEGVSIGGSISKGWKAFDSNSDIDMFAYLNLKRLPSIYTLSEFLKVQSESLRKRAFLIEYRIMLDGFDTNIKFFTISYLKRYVNAMPSLDQQYIEELESYQFQSILVDKGKLLHFFQKAKEKKLTDLKTLGKMSIERYGKSVGWAIFQGVGRGLKSVAFHALGQAVDALLCAYYISEGFYPPSLKWRASKKALSTLSRGNNVFKLLEKYMEVFYTANLNSIFLCLSDIEIEIAQKFDKAPWHNDAERWWWTPFENFNPTLFKELMERHY
ncbi:MAG: hypothetical protein GY795_42800 [Desulfobacterales bacterium]|nr:hypothetical protein [Desulfobacterales bacterium]